MTWILGLLSPVGTLLKVAGKLLVKAANALLDWIMEDWKNGPLLFLGLFAVVHLLVIDPRLQAERDAEKVGRAADNAAHRKTMEGFRTARRIAQQRAKDNVTRVKTEQAVITKEITDDFEKRIAAARARAGELERLRAGAGRADPGSATAAGVPGLPAAAAATDEAPDQAGLSPESGTLSLEDALIATEQAIQLDALIDWVEAQSGVNFVAEHDDGSR